MINDKPNHERVFNLLSDYEFHYSSEFRDRLSLLEYRKRVSELREQGHVIISKKRKDQNGNLRPGYQMVRPNELSLV